MKQITIRVTHKICGKMSKSWVVEWAMSCPCLKYQFLSMNSTLTKPRFWILVPKIKPNQIQDFFKILIPFNFWTENKHLIHCVIASVQNKNVFSSMIFIVQGWWRTVKGGLCLARETKCARKMVGFGTKSGKIAARFERQRNASGIINPSIFETFFSNLTFLICGNNLSMCLKFFFRGKWNWRSSN